LPHGSHFTEENEGNEVTLATRLFWKLRDSRRRDQRRRLAQENVIRSNQAAAVDAPSSSCLLPRLIGGAPLTSVLGHLILHDSFMKTPLKTWLFTISLLACALFSGCAGSKSQRTSKSGLAPATTGSAAPLAYQWYFNSTNQDDPRNWYDILDTDRTGF